MIRFYALMFKIYYTKNFRKKIKFFVKIIIFNFKCLKICWSILNSISFQFKIFFYFENCLSFCLSEKKKKKKKDEIFFV